MTKFDRIDEKIKEATKLLDNKLNYAVGFYNSIVEKTRDFDIAPLTVGLKEEGYSVKITFNLDEDYHNFRIFDDREYSASIDEIVNNPYQNLRFINLICLYESRILKHVCDEIDRIIDEIKHLN